MKKVFILLLGIASFSCQSSFAPALASSIAVKSILIKKEQVEDDKPLSFNFNSLVVVKGEAAVAIRKQSIMDLPLDSYILAYKDGKEWKVETDSSKFHEFLKNSQTKAIAKGEGNIIISGQSYPDKKYAFIIH